MPFDAFLKISTIPGESTDDGHAGWIEIQSFAWGASQKSGGHASMTPAHAGQRVDIQDLSITKQLDQASPKLFLSCCKGEEIPEVTLELCKAGGGKQKYMTYKLSKAIVSSYQPGGNKGGDDALPVEEVSFRFGKVELAYVPIDGNTPKGQVTAAWDLTKNTAA